MSEPKQQFIVKPHRPGWHKIKVIAALLMPLLFLVVGLLLGSRYFSAAMLEKGQQQKELQAMRVHVVDMEQRLANAELATEIDSVALEDVQQLLASLKIESATDKEELGLYRNLLQDGTAETGLMVGELVLSVLPGQQDISYRLVIQQKEVKFKQIKVNVRVSIEGIQGGEIKSFEIDELDQQYDQSPIEIEFKYFHLFQGVIALPANFKPSNVVVTLWKRGVKKSQVKRTFDWWLAKN